MDIYFLTPVDKLGGTNHCLPRQKDALDFLKIMPSEQYLMRRRMYRTLAYLESHMYFVTFRYHPQQCSLVESALIIHSSQLNFM